MGVGERPGVGAQVRVADEGGGASRYQGPSGVRALVRVEVGALVWPGTE